MHELHDRYFGFQGQWRFKGTWTLKHRKQIGELLGALAELADDIGPGPADQDAALERPGTVSPCGPPPKQTLRSRPFACSIENVLTR